MSGSRGKGTIRGERGGYHLTIVYNKTSVEEEIGGEVVKETTLN